MRLAQIHFVDVARPAKERGLNVGNYMGESEEVVLSGRREDSSATSNYFTRSSVRVSTLLAISRVSLEIVRLSRRSRSEKWMFEFAGSCSSLQSM